MELSLISPSSSSKPPDFKYEVFLNFNGEDTGNNFTSHLHRALRDKKIETFIDYEPRRGDDISPSFLTAIEESQIAIIVFSKGYASSRWCLEELVKIIQCKKIYGQIMIPVFYEIDPSDVRHQKGSFEDAFVQHEQRFKGSSDRVQRWKNALKEAADLSGLDSRVNKPESLLIEKIVQDVLKRLNAVPSSDNSDLIGIDSRIRKIELLLNTGSKDVRSVGIWGIGGIGKTTLAEAVFNKISCQFEGSYFTWSVREASEQSCGLNSLRRDLFSTILGGNIDSSFVGRTFTRKRLGRKKLLIVFDDVTSLEQIESLIGGFDCLGPQSRIIVTSRDKQVLKNCKVDQIYKVVELYYQDALKLFCRAAFGQNRPTTDFKELSEKVVEYVGGVPLALKVLGSSLFGKNKEFWESAMNKLENIYDKDIHEVLKISYDGLDSDQQSIFLDIACFFKGRDVNLVKAFMDASGFFTETGISALIDKSLVTISRNKLTMHDLLEAMGKEIVRQESIDSPGKRSRLWHHNDIINILTNDTGTETIEGISLNMSKIEDIHLNPRVFVKMQKLRFMKFHVYGQNYYNKVHVSQGLEAFFTGLRYLHWFGCPLKSLQSNFHSKNLVILEMPNSNVEELWSGVQPLDNLKEINLSGSRHLITCPDLSGAPNLKSLILRKCTSLFEIPSSIQHVKKLESLDLYYCQSLISIPDCSGLKHLQVLYLKCCSKLKMLPELPNNIGKLDLPSCTSLFKIPSSIQYLNKLESLYLSFCKSLTIIPDCTGLKSLRVLYLKGCSKLEILPELPNSIETLDLTGTAIEELPSSFEDLDKLENLYLTRCSRLKSLPSSICKWKSLQTLRAEEIAIREVPSSISCLNRLSVLSLSRCKVVDQVGLLLPPLLGLLDLKSLCLSDCGITDIPDSLGCLTSLETLYLDSNNFESLPASIINLSKLRYLDISNCEILKFLPRLRWAFIQADNCPSLEVLTCLSFQNDISALYTSAVARFINCFKLDQDLLKDVGKDVLLELQGLAPLIRKMYFDQIHARAPWPVYICYPGTEIPEWFTFQRRESFIDVELPPTWFNFNFLGFALCAVVAIPDHQSDHHEDDYYKNLYVRYDCNIKSKNGDRCVYSNKLCTLPYSGPVKIRSNHMIIGFDIHCFCEFCDNQFSFQFSVKDELKVECGMVEKCGVHLMYAQHPEESDNEPHRERLKQIE